ncbi:MAG: hypothetical protein QW524_03055 [Candidatus Woesearchaeota archaeon]
MKKADLNWTFISIILLIIAAFILFGYFTKLRFITEGIKYDYKCILNVITSERAKLAGVDQYPVLCRTQIKVIDVNNLKKGEDIEEKVALALLDELKICWARYGSGRFNIFSEWKIDETWCATCSILYFKNIGSIDKISYSKIYEIGQKYGLLNDVLLDNFNFFLDDYAMNCILKDQYISLVQPIYVSFVKKNMYRLFSGFVGQIGPKWIYRFTVGSILKFFKEKSCEVSNKDSINSITFYSHGKPDYFLMDFEECIDKANLQKFYYELKSFMDGKLSDNFLNLIRSIKSEPSYCSFYKELFEKAITDKDSEIYINALFYYLFLDSRPHIHSKVSSREVEVLEVPKTFESLMKECENRKKEVLNSCKDMEDTIEFINNINCSQIIILHSLSIPEINNAIVNKMIQDFKKCPKLGYFFLPFKPAFETSGYNPYVVSFGILNTELIYKLTFSNNCDKLCYEKILEYYNFFYRNNYISGVFLTSNLTFLTKEVCDIYIVP